MYNRTSVSEVRNSHTKSGYRNETLEKLLKLQAEKVFGWGLQADPNLPLPAKAAPATGQTGCSESPLATCRHIGNVACPGAAGPRRGAGPGWQPGTCPAASLAPSRTGEETGGRGVTQLVGQHTDREIT